MLVCEAGPLRGRIPCLVGEGIALSCPRSSILPSTVESRMCCFSGSPNSEPCSATQEERQKELALPSTPTSIPFSLPGLQVHGCLMSQASSLLSTFRSSGHWKAKSQE